MFTLAARAEETVNADVCVAIGVVFITPETITVGAVPAIKSLILTPPI